METSKCPLQPSNFSLGAIYVTEFSSKKDKFCIDFIGKSLAYLLIITSLPFKHFLRQNEIEKINVLWSVIPISLVLSFDYGSQNKIEDYNRNSTKKEGCCLKFKSKLADK